MKDEGVGRREDLKTRTKGFALRVIRLYGALPKRTEAQVIGRQLLRSATSVGAHFREATRGRSDAEFISKIEGGLQELDETDYWFGLLVKSGIVDTQRMQPLVDECDELIAMFTASAKTAKKNK